MIAFLDADDVWTANSLAVRVQQLDHEPGLDGVYGQIECFISPEVQASLFCPPTMQLGRLASSLLLRRHVFSRVGWFDTQIQLGETLDWIARADALNVRMAGVEQVVLRRRIHSTNTVLKTQQLHADYLSVLRAAIARRRIQENPTPTTDA